MRVVERFPLTSLRFRSVAGQRVVELYQQLNSTLDRQLSTQEPNIKHLFARPSINQRQGVVEWISELTGNQVSRFVDLDETAQQLVVNQLKQQLSLVDEVGGESRGGSGDQAELIGILAEYPRAEDIFIIDGTPVLINWGCEPREGTTETVGLFNAMPSVPSSPPPVEPESVPVAETINVVNRRRWSCPWSWSLPWSLLWLLLLLLLMAFLVRGCERFGVTPPTPDLMGTLPSIDPSIPAPSLQFEQDLRAEIDLLSQQLDNNIAACVREPETDADQRLLQHGSSAGVVNVALVWNNRHDLDLFVIDPSGEEISFRHKRAASGGFHDIDVNNTDETRTAEAIENIKWEGVEPPPGLYQVYIDFYKVFPGDIDIDPTPFTLTITIRGQTEEITGSISSDRLQTMIKFHEFSVE